MKILLVGPCPPPHGGVSVHISGIQKRLVASGIPCVLVDPGKAASKGRFALSLLSHSLRGWTIHLHTNGHNRRSWMLALTCGLAARLGDRGLLTMHSGMAPAYLERAGRLDLWLARVAAGLFGRVLCVNRDIYRAAVELGVSPARAEVTPASLGADLPDSELDAELLVWMRARRPLFVTAMSFRPEYGLEVLLVGLAMLRDRYPDLGCLILGGGSGQLEAEQEVSAVGLSYHVRMLGDVAHAECLSIFARCDVFLRPTLADGDSLSVREALALGVPVVASRVGSRPDEAILFDTGNADDLADKVEQALARSRPTAKATDNGIDRILECYRRQLTREGTP